MSKKVKIGSLYVGGDEKIKVQSMTTFKPSNIIDTVNQIKLLENAGCDIVRFSILNEDDAKAIKEIKGLKHGSMITMRLIKAKDPGGQIHTLRNIVFELK